MRIISGLYTDMILISTCFSPQCSPKSTTLALMRERRCWDLRILTIWTLSQRTISPAVWDIPAHHRLNATWRRLSGNSPFRSNAASSEAISLRRGSQPSLAPLPARRTKAQRSTRRPGKHGRRVDNPKSSIYNAPAIDCAPQLTMQPDQ